MGTLREDQYLLQFFLEWEMVQTKVVEQIKTHILYSATLFWKSCRLWACEEKNMVEPDKPQMTIWRMRIACWIPKAIDTHSEFVTLIFHCNSGCTNAPQCNIILRVHCLYSCHYNTFYLGNIKLSHLCGKNRFYRAVLDWRNQDSSVALVNRLRAGRTRNCGPISARNKIFFSARRLDRLQGSDSPPTEKRTVRSLSGAKAAGAWTWPFTST